MVKLDRRGFLLVLGASVALPFEAQADQIGVCSVYAQKYEGRKTASGKIFRHNSRFVAHASLPFGTKLRLTNLENGKTSIAVVEDRWGRRTSRVLDLPRLVASELGMDTERKLGLLEKVKVERI